MERLRWERVAIFYINFIYYRGTEIRSESSESHPMDLLEALFIYTLLPVLFRLTCVNFYAHFPILLVLQHFILIT